MRFDVVRLQLHNFLEQFGFLREVPLRPLDKRPVEVTVWIARSEMDRQSELVASLPIPLHVSKNARPIQVRDCQIGSDRDCGCSFRQGTLKVARVSESDCEINVRLGGLRSQPNHTLEESDR